MRSVLDSSKYVWILGRASGFWVLGSVFRFWEVFLDPEKCFVPMGHPNKGSFRVRKTLEA